jgi:tRNA-specific 2-thiouridylase
VSKDDVRRLAREFGLPVADKGDSQEVCFIPGDDYVAFLEGNAALADTRGEIVHLNGQLLGRHGGTHRYTVGQRKGLGIAWSEPLYVVAIDTENNRVIVGEQQSVFAEGLLATDLSWVINPRETEFAGSCKIRYRHQPVPCRVLILEDGTCQVSFLDPQKSITPGQSVVFYQGDEVRGGARIVSALRSQQ